MLTIIFAQAGGGDAPSLPDLYVQDAQTKELTPVAGLEGWDGDFLQTQTLTFAPMVFYRGGYLLSAGGVTVEFWCRRLSKALLNCKFSDSGATAAILPIYIDKNGILAYGETITISANSEVEDDKYGSNLSSISTYGTNKIKFKVISVSVGTVDVYMAGV